MTRAAALALIFCFVPGAAAAAASNAAAERGRVGFSSLAEASAAGADGVKRLVSYAAGKLQPLLDADLVPVDAHGASDAQIADACNANQVNAIVVFFYADKSVAQGAKRDELAEVHIDVFDCFGDITFDGAGSAEALLANANVRDAVYDEARIAADRAYAALRSDVNAAASVRDNLVRYGIPIRDGERTAGLKLRSEALGARARPMAFGTAARAGIRRDDLVTAINGVSLVGIEADQLNAVVRKTEADGGKYAAAVTHPDGTTATYTFSSEDLAGYLHL